MIRPGRQGISEAHDPFYLKFFRHIHLFIAERKKRIKRSGNFFFMRTQKTNEVLLRLRLFLMAFQNSWRKKGKGVREASLFPAVIPLGGLPSLCLAKIKRHKVVFELEAQKADFFKKSR